MKKCTKCGNTKDLNDFYEDSRKTDGHASECKKCHSKRGKIWREAHKEQQKMLSKRWYEEHKERERAKNRTSVKKWRTENPERKKEYGKKWAKENPESVRAIRLRTTAKKRATAKGKLDDALRNSIGQSLKQGVKNGRSWETLVGYTVSELKEHIEKKFLPGMTWENHGKWHIDHIIPQSAFNYEKPEDIDFKQCWALRNLRPLWAKDNIRKLNKLEKPFQPALAIAV